MLTLSHVFFPLSFLLTVQLHHAVITCPVQKSTTMVHMHVDIELIKVKWVSIREMYENYASEVRMNLSYDSY